MGVPAFKEDISALMGTTGPLVLAVSPDWDELDHLGAVSARVFPGTSLACPCLFQNSVVRVRRLSSVTSDEGIGESSSLRPSKRLRDSFPVEEGTSRIDASSIIRVTPSEHRSLRAAFRKEAKLSRSIFKDQLVAEWEG
jgi:hypothetical protein